MTNATLFFAAVGVIGMACQWLAWRLSAPPIVLLLFAGLVAGPATGVILPAKVLGGLITPFVAAAVAIILFEGGLSLDFRGLRDASQAVRRVVIIAAPLIWALIALSAHFVVMLSWPTSTVIGGILVITGPTVVQPLLRHARLDMRTAAVLRWEAIVNDVVGTLFAVLAFEAFAGMRSGSGGLQIAARMAADTGVAAGLGYAMGKAISYAYRTTFMPEYLKVPTIFVAVLACFVAGNRIMDEAGLLAVMIMGVTIGNSRIASLTEIRRFKEHAAVLLVSGVFVVLTANISRAMLSLPDPRSAIFAALLVFVIRPFGIALSTFGTNLAWRERLLIGWVAPRGVVAVAAAAVFGGALARAGVADGARIPALVFAIVMCTVVLYSLTTVPFARWLGLASSAQPGVLIVGSNDWTVALAKVLKSLDVEVMIADSSWWRLKPARQAGVAVYYGEILAELTEHRLDHARFGHLIAATESDSYNTLVCTDLGPTFGRQHVFQIGRMKSQELDPRDVALTLGGRTLMKAGYDLDSLTRRLGEGWDFRKTKLTDEFDLDRYRETLADESQLLFYLKPNGTLSFATVSPGPAPVAGDMVISFAPEVGG
jgi:NhaP-type Na+/H+ or K+/H+ antiporter